MIMRSVPPNPGQPGAIHYAAIDGMRAIAVLSVLVYHLQPELLPGGFIGVDIFFVISGFVVAASVARLPPSTGLGTFLAYFYARRVTRILPALVVCLLATALLSSLFIPNAWLSAVNDRTGLAAFLGASNFVLAYFAGDYFSPRSEFNPYTHTWSLGVEEQFYLTFPWLFFGWLRAGGSPDRRRRYIALLAALSVASFAWCARSTAREPTHAFYMLPARFWELGTGVLLFLGMSWWQPRLVALGKRTLASLAWAAIATLLVACWFVPSSRFPFPWALVPVAGSALLIAVVVTRPADGPARLLSSRPATIIGVGSYSIYLWHWPVIVLLRWTTGIETLGTRLVAAALSLGLAWVSYRWVEVRVRDAPRTKSAPRAAVLRYGLAGLLVVTGLYVTVYRSKASLSLSQTRNDRVWFPDALARSGGAAPRCAVARQDLPLGAGELTTFAPQGCAERAARGRLFVAGDSHAAAYAAMLRLYAERSGAEVHLLRKGGCSLFNLKAMNSTNGPQCGLFAEAAMRYLLANARAGDVLFLPSLRVARLADQWGARHGSTTTPPAAKDERPAAVEEAIAMLEPVSRRGVRLVFEAPKPVFRIPLFRCSDWFNKDNPVCGAGGDVSRVELLQHRASALAAVSQVASALPGTEVWDPFPVLCPPGPVCTPWSNGQPLFLDTDHLSGVGNELVLTDFAAFIERLL